MQGPITINAVHIINVRPYSSQNTNGVTNGTQINLSNGESHIVEENYDDIVELLDAEGVE